MADWTTSHEQLRPQRQAERRQPVLPLPRRARGPRGSSVPAPDVRPVRSLADAPVPARIRRRERLMRLALVGADALAIAAPIAFIGITAEAAFSLPALLIALAASVVLAKAGGLYDADVLVVRRSTLDEVPRLLQLAALAALAYWLVLDVALPRGEVVQLWLGATFALPASRFLARLAARHVLPTERCLVIGDVEMGQHVRRKLGLSRANSEIVAMVRVQPEDALDDVDGIESLRDVVEEMGIHRVIVAPSTADAEGVLALVRMSKHLGVRVSVVPRLLEVVGSSVEFDDIDGLTLLGVRRFGLTRTARAVKRGFDLVGSGVALLVLSPLLAATALAIRLDSPGPALFRQLRVGRDGDPFHILKFRSMSIDAEARKGELHARNEAGDGMFKITDDPRVTRVGRLLRKTSLDELPQLINVLRGEMSLVGPRPLVLDEDNLILGLDRQRLHLTPGMTGPWQVLGAARVPMAEMVSMDYIYVANWSLWMDVKLIVRTIGHVLSRGNA
jgi:exopolysaccharide biosynthesis polyprenyl glycosylphosphotransferase